MSQEKGSRNTHQIFGDASGHIWWTENVWCWLNHDLGHTCQKFKHKLVKNVGTPELKN
jgi:hypothetical protein